MPFQIDNRSINTQIPTLQDKQLLIVDNYYDEYIKLQYLKHIRASGIKYIWSQDNDLSYLSEMPDIECIAASNEAVSIEALYALNELKYLCLGTDNLEFDYALLSASLEYLHTKYETANKSWLNLETLKALEFTDFSTVDLQLLHSCKSKQQIEQFAVNVSFGKFKALNGIEALANLKFLGLNYCRRLEDITAIKQLKKLKTLHIFDAIQRLNLLPVFELTNLEELYLISGDEGGKKTINSIKLLNNLPNLKRCVTNYNILDGDLKPLLKLEHAEIIEDKNHYNLKDKKLPKKEIKK